MTRHSNLEESQREHIRDEMVTLKQAMIELGYANIEPAVFMAEVTRSIDILVGLYFSQSPSRSALEAFGEVGSAPEAQMWELAKQKWQEEKFIILLIYPLLNATTRGDFLDALREHSI